MDGQQPPISIEDPTSTVWDFADLLDFTPGDHLFPDPWDPSAVVRTTSDPNPDALPTLTDSIDRSRKRDPRLVCSNFLAGHIPCACPEIDEKLEEESLPRKKRTRTYRSAGSIVIRCQVPSCEADIAGLKGYHRRHRVCLCCANATSVIMDGETKRYCQQCGKFHILSDFDEGKRSCRRKLERHNNRRRRKHVIPDNAVGKEFKQDVSTDDVRCEDEEGKDILCSSSQLVDKEPSLEPEDGQVSPPCSAPEFQTVDQTDSAVSFEASRNIQAICPKEDPKRSLSLPCCDNRSAYSSMCPTGRVSFKLYDWNPAEFPRRLRLQVFQWLSSMPVELEGYIRPGCTILTMFIAMPKFMWEKLSEDPVSSIQDFVVQPGSVIPARSTFLVYLNNMVFCVLKGGPSVVKGKVADQAPRLHYVHPMCFEVGGPVEFVACGSNLLGSKFRFLVSFGGKYLACESSLLSTEYGFEERKDHEIEYQFYKIRISRTHPDLFGPAFIEVEDEFSGLSNFIPVLFSDKEVCSEMKRIQQTVEESFQKMDSDFSGTDFSCKTLIEGKNTISEFLVDIGWLLKEPLENPYNDLSAWHMQRFTCLLNFLMENESTVILEKILPILSKLMGEFGCTGAYRSFNGVDIDILNAKMEFAKDFLCNKLQSVGATDPFPGLSDLNSPTSVEVYQDMEYKNPESATAMILITREDVAPLLDFEGGKSAILVKKSMSRQISFPSILKSRLAVYIIAVAAVCFGVCAVLLHPHKVVYVHRRLFGNP
ncbi:hypothetical protein SAY86_027976 [Trapa natans]|uniref:SBP-type domain-containing protein n=1 Tax=Trapa natans TaxID=22666 RepID=A0AAN7RBS2_TRANT|nr:hypothetical protein SAY86_027976 [Trapa natans]